MTSNRFPWVAMLVLAASAGCAMCDNSQDCTYPAFGGKWQRDNPYSGRVASLFDPAGHRMVAPAALAAPTEATPAPDEAETPETAESTEPTLETEGAPESTLKKPADQDSATMPSEQPKTEDRKKADTNLLPPLELPPQP